MVFNATLKSIRDFKKAVLLCAIIETIWHWAVGVVLQNFFDGQLHGFVDGDNKVAQFKIDLRKIHVIISENRNIKFVVDSCCSGIKILLLSFFYDFAGSQSQLSVFVTTGAKAKKAANQTTILVIAATPFFGFQQRKRIV